MLPKNIFVNVRASRFRQTGERVFVTDSGERFGLGVPTTITVTPIEVTGGYRFDRGWRLIPYGGAASAVTGTRSCPSSPKGRRT